LPDYEPINVREMANKIQERVGTQPIKTAPVSISKIIAAFGDALGNVGWNEFPLTSFRLDNLLISMIHNLNSLADVIGVLPYSLQEGISLTCDWLEDQKRAKVN
jgi:GlcNAc-P-P-Und epimerase